MNDFSRLFSPFAKGRLATPSRLVILPHGTAMVREGNLTDDDIAYYEARTRGGVGMVITGAAIASPSSALRVRNLIEAWDENTRAMLGKRARVVQRNGAKMICQILHLGREFTGGDSEFPPAAPSAVRSPRDPYPPHELSDREIRTIIGDFARSAENIVKSGCDGVELHAAHGYLFAQFLSAAVNKRSDRWGGTPEKRLRFLLETVEAVRVRAGKDFVLGVRLSADEEIPDGLGVRDTVAICQALAATGAIDYVNITIGMRGAYVKDATWPEAPAATAAGIVRRECGLPVILGQKIAIAREGRAIAGRRCRRFHRRRARLYRRCGLWREGGGGAGEPDSPLRRAQSRLPRLHAPSALRGIARDRARDPGGFRAIDERRCCEARCRDRRRAGRHGGGARRRDSRA